jgi:hypothetical protein
MTDLLQLLDTLRLQHRLLTAALAYYTTGCVTEEESTDVDVVLVDTSDFLREARDMGYRLQLLEDALPSVEDTVRTVRVHRR